MIPVLPKVKGLMHKQISNFGGIDKRVGAKENTFSDLVGVDNTDGMALRTNGKFPSAETGFEIECDDILAITNEEGGKDIYTLGKGGFYKNGVLLDFQNAYQNIDISWASEYAPGFELGDSGEINWTGDYTRSKLIRYGKFVFAIPQMIVTDGEKSFRWDGMAFGAVSASYVSVSGGELTIKYNNRWRTSVAEYMKVGDKIDLFVNQNKRGGTFTVLKNELSTLIVKCINSSGENHTANTLGLTSSGEQHFAFRQTEVPGFVDAAVVYNRMWGISGNRVYASKLAHPFAFKECDGTESDAWWADTEDSNDFTAIASFNGRVTAFKSSSAYEIYGTVTPYTIKDISKSLGCIDKNSLCEVNGVLFLLTKEGVCVYGGSKFINVNDTLCYDGNEMKGLGIGSKFYALTPGGVFKYDYYTGLWTNITGMSLKGISKLDSDVFGICEDGKLVQLTGNRKNYLTYDGITESPWLIESAEIGGSDFYAEGINRFEMRFMCETVGTIKVEISTDSGDYITCFEGEINGRWQILTVPVSFKACSVFRYRVSGTGKLLLKLIRYSFRKGGGADKYE